LEPLLGALPGPLAVAGSHAVAVVISFVIITMLHIVLGELAPKSLALQRSEGTALWVVRPLGLFLFVLRPAIITLNGLGNLVLRLVGLRPGTGEDSLHSPEELKLLVAASQEAGLLQHTQQEVMARVLTIGNRPIGDIMTPRRDVEWIDADDPQEDILRTIRDCRHDQLLVGRGDIAELAAAVVAAAGVSLRVLVGQHRALRLEHGARHEVLARDHLEGAALAAELLLERCGDLGIDLGERGIEQGRHGRLLDTQTDVHNGIR